MPHLSMPRNRPGTGEVIGVERAEGPNPRINKGPGADRQPSRGKKWPARAIDLPTDPSKLATRMRKSEEYARHL